MRGKIKSKHKKDFKMCKKISFFKSFELFSGASFKKKYNLKCKNTFVWFYECKIQ